MQPLKIMISFYLLGEPITAWALLTAAAVFVLVSFFSSKNNKDGNNRFDRLFLMSGVFAVIGLALLLHFYTGGSGKAVELIREAYRFPRIFE